MVNPQQIRQHYHHDTLLDVIRAGVTALGKTPQTVNVDDLAPVDEFHIGSRKATQEFLDQLSLSREEHVLDVGCGLGGAARFAASRYGCRVTGVDLTRAFVETGNTLCAWVGLDERIALHEGDALAMLFGDGAFDAAYLMHVAMNIADKATLFAELRRVLRPGGRLGIYDIMRTGAGALSYPVPWASDADGSALATPAEYRRMLHAAGFEITAERDRRALAFEFFAQAQASLVTAGAPPPLGLHLVMGARTADKLANVTTHVRAGDISPIELIARAPD